MRRGELLNTLERFENSLSRTYRLASDQGPQDEKVRNIEGIRREIMDLYPLVNRIGLLGSISVEHITLALENHCKELTALVESGKDVDRKIVEVRDTIASLRSTLLRRRGMPTIAKIILIVFIAITMLMLMLLRPG